MESKVSGNIICFGSLIMDISIRCERIPVLGETVYTGEDYQVNPGGKGGNQAVAAARSGGNVTLIGRISDDDYGHQLFENFQADHIDTSHLVVDKKSKTGVAFVWVDKDGNNSCLCSLGVNDKVTPQDIRACRHLFGEGDIVLTTLEHSREILDEITMMAFQNHCVLIVDPSSKDYDKLTPEIAKRIDILKPNEVEAQMLTGIQIKDRESAIEAINVLKEKGIRIPMISLGEKGVIYEYQNTMITVEGKQVKTIDTTAAGDTFIGALAAKLSLGHSVYEAVDYANRAAACCVQCCGAQISIPFEKNVL